MEKGRTDLLSQALRKVQKRLFLHRFVRVLSLDLLIFASLFAVLLAAERSCAFGWDLLLLVGVTTGAWLVTSLARALAFGRVDVATAAATTDVRLRLDERVSSAVYLRDHPEAREETEWTELVYRDGVSSLQGVDLRKHFPLELPRWVWLTVVPVLVAVALWVWMPSIDLLGYQATREVEAAMKRELEEPHKDLIAELRQLEAEAKDKDYEQFQKDLAELRKAAERQLEGRKPDDGNESRPAAEDAKKRALTRINKQLDQVEKKLARTKRFQDARKALESIRRTGLQDQKLTRKLMHALKRRNLKEATAELDTLKKDLESLFVKAKSQSGLSTQEKKKLERLAGEFQRMSERTKSSPGLSRSLESAAQSLKRQDFQHAQQGLKLAQKELDELAKSLDQMKMLQTAQDALQTAQKQLSRINKHKCPNCGKNRAAGSGQKPGQKPGGT